VREFTETLTTYGISRVSGDRYGAAGGVAEEFEKQGIRCRPSDKPKSQLYVELLPALNSGRVRLLVHEKLVNQQLEDEILE